MEPEEEKEQEPIDLVIDCPHCKEHILIEKLNCCIFRHGILKSNGKQIDPHSSKELCDFYIQKDLIFGCGKPFQIIKNDKNEFISVICDYI
jgi:hypothetical protein